MKIAYIAFVDISQENGVAKKILDQVSTWTDNGTSAKLFAISVGHEIWCEVKSIPTEVIWCETFLQCWMQMKGLADKVESWEPDLIYLRFALYFYPLERLLSHFPTVVEINTDDLPEFRLSFPKFKFLYHCLTRGRILKKVRGMVFVTDELSMRFWQYDAEKITIGNGINLARFPELRCPNNAAPRLIFSGTPGYIWNGIDHGIALAGHFPNWQFDIVGCNATEYPGIKPGNVRFNGYLAADAYQDLMSMADIALGTLALYRKKMSEASPLKVLEYMAYGIPTIIGYRETNFPDDAPFLLRISNSSDSIAKNLDRIRKFVESWQGKRVSRKEVSHIDVNLKEIKRLNFFQSLI